MTEKLYEYAIINRMHDLYRSYHTVPVSLRMTVNRQAASISQLQQHISMVLFSMHQMSARLLAYQRAHAVGDARVVEP